MKRENVIDMTGYFLELQKRTAPHRDPCGAVKKTFYVLANMLETVATVVIGLCVCVCTLMFFTIL